MKQILILSDSHVNNPIVNRIFEHYPDIDTCIHCGDIQDNPNDLKIKHLYAVKGNNDFYDLENKLIIEIENKRFFIAHGHLHNVEFSLDQLIEEAKDNNADVTCYGHTHDPIKRYEGNLLVINPGSVRFPRGGKVFIPTYIILTIDDNGLIEVHFYHAKTYENVDDIVAGKKRKDKTNKKGFFSFFKK